jgi:hypothetical protein
MLDDVVFKTESTSARSFWKRLFSNEIITGFALLPGMTEAPNFAAQIA